MPQNRATPHKRATIRDVAELAGVSISTVSHVFSGSRPISDATVERVKLAADKLRYQANPSAKNLRTAKAGIIGLIVRPKDAIHGTIRGTETFQRLLGSIATHALEQGRGMIHVPDVLDPTSISVPMDVCIVAHPYRNDQVVAKLRSRGVPLVMIDTDPAHADLPWAVNIDHTLAPRAFLDAFLAEGRRRISYISGTEDNAWNRDGVAVYLAWCAEQGLATDHHEVYEGEGIEGSIRVARDLLAREDRPDAILTGPSTFAHGVLLVAQELGIRVPEDLALATLTDSERTRASQPPITSLDLCMEDAGAEAVRLAIALSDGAAPPATPVTISPEILWRTSLPQPTDLRPAAA